jgi:Phage P22-like portal protein
VVTAKTSQDQLSGIKKNIEKSHEYFQDNVKRYNYFRQFVFQSSLSEADRAALRETNKPILEFNSLEAFISRLRGEFSKQEPSIAVRLLDHSGLDPSLPLILEGHLRSIFDQANHNGCAYEVYTDILSGGFSAMKVWTEYQHENSFEQVIKIGRVYDPTLVGFDPLAVLPHKGDGHYCFELIPKTKEEFQAEYPDIDLSTIKFSKNVEGFNWTYQNQQEEILLLCDYYEKKKKPKKLLRLSNGYTLLSEDYKKLEQHWQETRRLEQLPTVVEERTTFLETIHRYRLIESTVLQHEEINYQFLPIVYVDGNSIRLNNNGQTQQVTRPYVYHALGNQKLKNFAGQCLANELENMVMHKWKVAAEAIPEKYLEAYTNPQKASVLVYNAFLENSQGMIPLPPPQEVGRVSAPPEIIQTFTNADATMQSILGSYDASLGINNNQLSGVAIVEGATQSNAAAMPYVVSFLQSLNQVAHIIVDLIPKYYVTPRTLPITLPDGKRDYALINQQGGITLKYRTEQLEVCISAGVNFAIQKSRALQQIIALMQASPLFAQFINTEGLPILLDNLEIRGIDQLKAQAENFTQQLKAQQQQAMNQPDPHQEKLQLEKAKLSAELQHNQLQQAHKTRELDLAKANIDTDRMKLMAELQVSHNQNLVQLEKTQTERLARAIDLALKMNASKSKLTI